MKKINIEEENTRLKEEIVKSQKGNKKLAQKLENSKIQIDQLKKELKKNSAQKVILNKEQEQLLLNLSKDINIPNLLSD